MIQHWIIKILKKQGVKIWNKNASKEFLEGRGLRYEEDDLGPIYGFQWRHFNAAYETCNTDYNGKGVDQLAKVIECLKDPFIQKVYFYFYRNYFFGNYFF